MYGLAVTPNGMLLAGDARDGLLTSRDGGRTWRRTLDQPVVGVAVNPADSDVVLAATPLGLYRSETQGDSWSLAFPLAEGTGPLAWSPSEPRVAYAVGFDKRLYRSGDRGETWRAVDAEG